MDAEDEDDEEYDDFGPIRFAGAELLNSQIKWIIHPSTNQSTWKIELEGILRIEKNGTIRDLRKKGEIINEEFQMLYDELDEFFERFEDDDDDDVSPEIKTMFMVFYAMERKSVFNDITQVFNIDNELPCYDEIADYHDSYQSEKEEAIVKGKKNAIPLFPIDQIPKKELDECREYQIERINKYLEAQREKEKEAKKKEEEEMKRKAEEEKKKQELLKIKKI